MLFRVLSTVFALLVLGETAFAANQWSAPYILTPLEYKNLSFAKRQASLDRRHVWNDVGQLMSRQATCEAGFAEVCSVSLFAT